MYKRIFILCVKMLSVWKTVQVRWWLSLGCFYSLQQPHNIKICFWQ